MQIFVSSRSRGSITALGASAASPSHAPRLQNRPADRLADQMPELYSPPSPAKQSHRLAGRSQALRSLPEIASVTELPGCCRIEIPALYPWPPPMYIHQVYTTRFPITNDFPRVAPCGSAQSSPDSIVVRPLPNPRLSGGQQAK